MARLANISGKQAVKVFKKFGWNVVGQVGSHVVMTKPGMKANLSVPQHKSIHRIAQETYQICRD